MKFPLDYVLDSLAGATEGGNKQDIANLQAIARIFQENGFTKTAEKSMSVAIENENMDFFLGRAKKSLQNMAVEENIVPVI